MKQQVLKSNLYFDICCFVVFLRRNLLCIVLMHTRMPCGGEGPVSADPGGFLLCSHCTSSLCFVITWICRRPRRPRSAASWKGRLGGQKMGRGRTCLGYLGHYRLPKPHQYSVPVAAGGTETKQVNVRPRLNWTLKLFHTRFSVGGEFVHRGEFFYLSGC